MPSPLSSDLLFLANRSIHLWGDPQSVAAFRKTPAWHSLAASASERHNLFYPFSHRRASHVFVTFPWEIHASRALDALQKFHAKNEAAPWFVGTILEGAAETDNAALRRFFELHAERPSWFIPAVPVPSSPTAESLRLAALATLHSNRLLARRGNAIHAGLAREDDAWLPGKYSYAPLRFSSSDSESDMLISSSPGLDDRNAGADRVARGTMSPVNARSADSTVMRRLDDGTYRANRSDIPHAALPQKRTASVTPPPLDDGTCRPNRSDFPQDILPQKLTVSNLPPASRKRMRNADALPTPPTNLSELSSTGTSPETFDNAAHSGRLALLPDKDRRQRIAFSLRPRPEAAEDVFLPGADAEQPSSGSNDPPESRQVQASFPSRNRWGVLWTSKPADLTDLRNSMEMTLPTPPTLKSDLAAVDLEGGGSSGGMLMARSSRALDRDSYESGFSTHGAENANFGRGSEGRDLSAVKVARAQELRDDLMSDRGALGIDLDELPAVGHPLLDVRLGRARAENDALYSGSSQVNTSSSRNSVSFAAVPTNDPSNSRLSSIPFPSANPDDAWRHHAKTELVQAHASIQAWAGRAMRAEAMLEEAREERRRLEGERERLLREVVELARERDRAA